MKDRLFQLRRKLYVGMIDHCSYIHNLSNCEIKARKNSGLNWIRTHDLSDTNAVLYQVSQLRPGHNSQLVTRGISVYNCDDQYYLQITYCCGKHTYPKILNQSSRIQGLVDTLYWSAEAALCHQD